MSLPAASVTVSLQDSNGKRTSRIFEARDAAITDAQAQAVANAVQALTQLEVVDLQVSRRVTGFTPTAAEVNSSTRESASLRVPLASGGYQSFNLPALKAAKKSGTNVVVDADVLAFLALFDNGDGTAASAGTLYCNDGEEISETVLEDSPNLIEGKVNT